MDASEERFVRRVRPGLLWRAVHIAFIVLSIALTARWAQEAISHYLPKDWSKAHEFDGLQDWLAAQVYFRGQSPYSPEGLAALNVSAFGHPPTTPFWFLPLAHLTKAQAAELWDLSTLLLLWIHLFVCAKEVKFPAPVTLSTLLFTWALTTEGMVQHWHLIQLSEQIAFPLTLCWLYLRRGRQLPAGFALGVAATIKPFPGVLMLFLLFARRWRAFVGAAAVYGTIALVVTARFGMDCWKLFLTQQGPVARDWMGNQRNASLQGVMVRLISPACAGPAVPTSTSTAWATTLSVLLIIVGALLSRKALKIARTGDPRAIDLPFSLFTVIAVFVNPWIWEHYWVLLIQPSFALLSAVYSRAHSSLAGWLEEQLPTRDVVRDAAMFAFGALGVGSIVWLINTQDIRIAAEMLSLWVSTKSQWAHHQMHLHEAFNSAPWVIMIALCLACGVQARAPRAQINDPLAQLPEVDAQSHGRN